MKRDNDILAQALSQLKNTGRSEQPPQAVIDETIRRLADAQSASPDRTPVREPRRIAIGKVMARWLPAAAALILVGYAFGRLSRPTPLNMEQLREALTPAVAAAIEPEIRAKVVEDVQQRYETALVATYVKVKEELTEQYQDGLNRFAVQMLAASNAETNRLLTNLVENIDTMQTQDLTRVARAIHQIELNRMQDKTQLAAGLQRLASRTEDELTRTRQEFVQLLVDVRPEDSNAQPNRSIRIPTERTEQ